MKTLGALFRVWYWRVRGNRRRAGAIAGWMTRRGPKVFSYFVQPQTQADAAAVVNAADAGTSRCVCHRCIRENDLRGDGGMPLSVEAMILCEVCGNKRCPHASDHRLACTDSNEFNQSGSVYVA